MIFAFRCLNPSHRTHRRCVFAACLSRHMEENPSRRIARSKGM